jgi:hypothetical protein
MTELLTLGVFLSIFGLAIFMIAFSVMPEWAQILLTLMIMFIFVDFLFKIFLRTL